MGLVSDALHLAYLPLVAIAGLLALLRVAVEDAFVKHEPPPKPKCIVVTGASSGFGRAIAVHYASPEVSLILISRREDKLATVAEECTRRGALVRCGIVDVRDESAVRSFLLRMDAEGPPVDCIFANAGTADAVLAQSGIFGDEAERVIVDTNLNGVLNTVQPLLPAMRARRCGRIVLSSSISGCAVFVTDDGLGAAYCASKAGVRAYGEALRAILFRDGLRVNIICPGPTESEMTLANKSSGRALPLVPMDQAVSAIAAGLLRDDPLIAFPAAAHSVIWAALRVLPANLVHAIARRRHNFIPLTNYLPPQPISLLPV